MIDLPFATVYVALRERFEIEQGDPARQLIADLAGKPAADIAGALSALVMPRTDEVVVLWPHDRRAGRMRVAELVGHITDLWHPGSDDLLAAHPDREWVVLLDHQSQLWFIED